MMGPGGNLNYSTASAATYQQMLNNLGLAAGYSAQQQAAALSQIGLAYPTSQPTAMPPTGAVAPAYAGGGQPYPTVSAANPANPPLIQMPNVKFIKLPFYDTHGDLFGPASLLPQAGNRFQETHFQFQMTAPQATNIASNRDIRMGGKLDYLYQVQLRFCQLNKDGTSVADTEHLDEFPPGVCVQVNNRLCPLPNPIPTNKPNTEPRRPPQPVNITPLLKLTPTLPNTVSVKWAVSAAADGSGPVAWAVGLWLVEKLSSAELLDRLKRRGSRDSDYTRDLIRRKLTCTDEDEIATTNLKVTVACPLGRSRMTVPCRPSTCDHLQCFDAVLFLQMNERKPTWRCPVCDSPAKYDTLLVDGYFTEVIGSPALPVEENEIILNEDGSWHPVVPKDDEEAAKKKKRMEEEAAANGDNGDLVDLSDEEGSSGTTPTAAAASNGGASTTDAAAKPASIECIDIE